MFSEVCGYISTERGLKPDYISFVVTFVVSFCLNRVFLKFLLVTRQVLFILIEGCWFIEYFFIGGELRQAFYDSLRNLLNDIWSVVRCYMYWLDYVIWFLAGSVSAVVEIKNDIQIIYYFHITLNNYVQTFVLK